jgi:hypothetical protein
VTGPLILPESQPAGASSWAVTDYRPVILTSVPAAEGLAIAVGPQLELGELWLVDRIVASCTSTTASELRVYESNASPAFLLSGTASGNMDEADYPGGMLLQPGGELLAVWSNVSDGAVGTLRAQIRVLRYGG